MIIHSGIGTGSLQVSGSFGVLGSSLFSGSVIVTEGITGSLFGTSSWAYNAATSSYVLNAESASYSATASSADNFLIRQNATASNLLVNNTITAQTLIVNIVSSSVIYSSGSNIFGDQLSDSQQLTGSVTVTGSLSLNNDPVITQTSYNAFSSSIQSRATNLESTASVLTTASASFATVSSSFATTSGSLSTRTANLESTASVLTTASASFATVSGSYASASGSLSTRITTLENASSSFAQDSGSNSIRLTNLESTASILTTASASFSVVSSSYASASGSISTRLNIIETSYATTGSNTFNGSQTINGSLNTTDNITGSNVLVTGTLTAQTIIAQYITSSTEFITGSTKFGTQLTNTHQFTGSVTITGSLALNNDPVITQTPYNTFSSSIQFRATNLESTASILTSASASLATDSGSNSIRLTNLETTASILTITSASFAIVSASYASASGSLSTRVTTLENASSSFAQDSGSNSIRFTNLESTASVLTTASASLAIVSSSYASASGSLSNRATNLESTASVLTTASASFAIVSSSYASASGSLSTRVTTLENASASFASDSGSNSVRFANLESTASILVQASASFSASIAQLQEFSSSLDTGYVTEAELAAATASLSSSIAILSSSFLSTSQSVSNRVTIIEGNYATTGSNIFRGLQTIHGNLFMSGTFPLVYNNDSANNMLFGMFDGSAIYGPYYQLFGNQYPNLSQRGGAEFVYDIRNNADANFHISSFNGSNWFQKFMVNDRGVEITGSLNVSGGITGSFSGSVANIDGSTNYIAKFDSPNSVDSSVIYQSASHIAINETNFTADNPEALYVFQTHPTSINVLTGKGNLNNYLQNNIQNTNQGVSASSDVVATANNGSETSNYIDMGINSVNYNQGFIGGPNDAYLYSIANNLHIGSAATGSQHVALFVGGSDVDANTKIQLNTNNRHIMSGSFSLTGSLNVLEGITGSLLGTASFADNTTLAATASSADNFLVRQSITASNLLVNNTITAQTLVVQTITSSVDFVTGSTRFGTQLTDTHQFTGSVSITGSLSVNNSPVVTNASYDTFSSSISLRATNLEATASTLTTASASFALVSASFSSTSQSISNRVHIIEGNYATTGSNIFVGNQTVTGSLFTSGSNTLVGSTALTGSLNISGSTVQVGNNTLLGNTTLSGSIIISGTLGSTPSVKIYGDTQHNGYIRFDPVTTNINTSISASYIFVSGSTQDLYFSQNGNGYANTTRLRWLEGNLYTGLLNGGLITSQSSTTYQISSGSGIIVNLNASFNDNPYPTIQYLNWSNLSASIAQLSASYDQTFVAVDSTGQIFAQGTPYSDGQYNTVIPIGVVLHQNRSTINGTQTFPSLGYGWKQRSSDFIRAFGPLKLSGLTLAVSGSSTGSLLVGSGTAWSDGRNYSIDPNNPSYITDSGTNVSKIFRYRQSGSAAWVYDTNGGAGYTTIDPSQYSNNGVLTGVGAGNWSIQRVFWFPNSVTKAIYVYYGNAIYSTEADAIANINIESFVEAPNTAAQAIYVGAIVISGNGVFTNSNTYKIIPGGLFRAVGGSGGGGSVITQTLSGLSDVSISGPTNGQPLVYNSTSGKWQNSSTLTATLTGNADTATSASHALTSSYAITSSHAIQADTASYVLQAVSSSFATTASYSRTATTASYAFSAQSSSFATNASTASNVQGGLATYIPLWNTNTSLTSSYLNQASDTLKTIYNGTDRGLSLNYAVDSYILGNPGVGNSTYLQVFDGGSVINIYSPSYTYFNDKVGVRIIPTNPGLAVSGSLEVTGPGTTKLINTNAEITGALNVSAGITGSLFGTASWAQNASTASFVLNAVSASFATTASYVLNAVSSSFAATASSTVSSSFAVTASYASTASAATNFTVASTLAIDGTLTDYATIASSVVGSNNLFTQPVGSFTSAFFKYTVTNGSNARSGQVMSVWNGSTVEFTDNSTVDIGTTNAVTCSISIVGSDVQFNIRTNTSGWSIKSLATYM